MITYLQRLLSERDELTAAATSIADKATERNEDLTELEQAQLASMATRCAEIDKQVETYNQQAQATRAYAQLRASVVAADQNADGEQDRDRGTGRVGAAPGSGLARRGAATVATADTSWAEPFMRSGVLENYHGYGTSPRVDLGPVYESRDAITTADLVEPPVRWTGNATPSWRPTLLDLATVVQTAFGAVDWIRYQPNPPSPAQVVAEGALKPEATVTIVQDSATLQTYAHFKAITRQALEDWPQIRGEIETRLRAGVLIALQNALAAAIAADTDIPTATGADLLSAIRVGMGTLDDSNGYVPTGVLLNPADWAAIDLEVLTRTLNGPVVNNATFGLRFVASNSVPQGTAYVGDFRAALTLFQRNATAVYLTDSHADNFLRNVLVLLAEARAFAAVTEPLALVKVTAAASGGGGDGGTNGGSGTGDAGTGTGTNGGTGTGTA